MKRQSVSAVILAVLAILLAGCGGLLGGEDSPQTTLADAVDHMNSLDGYQFQLSHEGPPVYVDAEDTTEFLNASGHFVAPDEVETTIKISLQSIVAEISVISLGERQWASNPLTGSYQEIDDTFSYRPATFFNPESGFFATLGREITGLEQVGEEELEEMPGLKLQHLTGMIPGDVISEVSYGLIEVESIHVDLWVDPGANEIHRVSLTDPSTSDAEEPSVWQLDFWNFGETKVIEAPES